MSSEPVTFERVWKRIVANEHQFFRTHRQRWFTYAIEGQCVLPSHTDLRVPRGEFELVLPMLPLADPRKIAKFVTGYEYVAAILADSRISSGEW